MKTFLTEYIWNGKRYGDDIEAENWGEAQREAARRGRGEQIVGELVMRIPDDVDEARADRIIAAQYRRGSRTVH